jgi:hypothetical protein
MINKGDKRNSSEIKFIHHDVTVSESLSPCYGPFKVVIEIIAKIMK